jgi:hypothetical protein
MGNESNLIHPIKVKAVEKSSPVWFASVLDKYCNDELSNAIDLVLATLFFVGSTFVIVS